MAPRPTSTRRPVQRLSAGSPSPISTDSSPDTPEIPNPEAAAPDPPDLDTPVSSPEPALSEAAAGAVELIALQGLQEAIRRQLAFLVSAIDTYTGQGGLWDDVLYQTELAKALLSHTVG